MVAPSPHREEERRLSEFSRRICFADCGAAVAKRDANAHLSGMKVGKEVVCGNYSPISRRTSQKRSASPGPWRTSVSFGGEAGDEERIDSFLGEETMLEIAASLRRRWIGGTLPAGELAFPSCVTLDAGGRMAPEELNRRSRELECGGRI